MIGDGEGNERGVTAGPNASDGASKVVGVLGGLGPEATVDFLSKVVARSGATADQEHIRLIVDINPTVPDRNRAVAGEGPSPGPALAAMARGLERAGADFLVMVCNTAHAFQGDISSATDLPFVSLIDETVAATLTRAPAARTVGVLATAGSLDARLYQDAFAERGVGVVAPENESRRRFMELLYRIKRGDKTSAVRGAMLELAAELIGAGAEAVVAGCTEVPLVLSSEELRGVAAHLPLVDSTEALVEATIAYARGTPLPSR